MLKKRNLIFLFLFILGILLLTSCFLKPPVTEGILKGQIMVPEGTVQTKDLTGQALPDATVNIIDFATDEIIATTTTDANGYYQVFVPPGGPYLLEATKDGVKLLQFTPQVEVGIEYDLGTADCSTTSVTLIAQAMMEAEDYPDDLANINLTDIETDSDFNDVMSEVYGIIEAGGDPTVSAAVLQAVEDFLYPPAPTPAPTPAPSPTPTYLVTFDSQGGSVVSSQTVNYGGKVTEPTAAPTKEGYTFDGWYKESGCSNAWVFASDTVTTDVTLYAKWTINTYTVTFNKNGGDIEANPATKTATYGGNVGTLPTEPTRTGYTFTSWNTEAGGSGTEFTAATAVTADITVFAKWTPLYALRDTGPAGGWIFYVKESGYSDGWMYLEAAPNDQSSRAWGTFNLTVPGADGIEIGTGQQNTLDIIGGDDLSDIAADECANYSIVNGGVTYDDWFLPSKNELNQMYMNLKANGIGGFTVFSYWSSSESNAGYAWFQSFTNDYQYYGNY